MSDELNLDSPEDGGAGAEGGGGAGAGFDLWEDPEVVEFPAPDDDDDGGEGKGSGKDQPNGDGAGGKDDDDEDDAEPPKWFTQMVEEEGEEAAERYAEFLAGRAQDGGGAEGDDGEGKKPEAPAQAVEEHDEWAWQQSAVAAQTEYQTLGQKSTELIGQYEALVKDVKGIESRISALEEAGETGETSGIAELRRARDQLKSQGDRLVKEWDPIDKKLKGLETSIVINQTVERDAKLVPEIAANKTIYAKLVGDGKITTGITRQQVVDLINAERTKAGKPPAGGKGKASEAWARVRKLGPKGVGGGKGGKGSGGKGGAGGKPPDYSQFSPNVAAMLRRADARLDKSRKGGK